MDSAEGLLLIDKPAGWTSFDAVAKVRGVLKKGGAAKPKVGHTGTLDPLATGLLVLTVGSYCKRAGEFSKLDKTYDVEVTLGQTSTTDDSEGQKTAAGSYRPSHDELSAAVQGFMGEQLQVPPAFSAIKVGGKRAYKLARAGQAPVMEPRRITVYDITGVTYDYPRLGFSARVSSGTYLRSLSRDLGEKLGTGAYLSGLRRTSVGPFSLADARQLADLTPENLGLSLVQAPTPRS